MRNQFFDFVKDRLKHSKKKFRIVIIKYSMRKMLSDSVLDLGKCPHRKTHESESACFLAVHCNAVHCTALDCTQKPLRFYSVSCIYVFSSSSSSRQNALNPILERGSAVLLLQLQLRHAQATLPWILKRGGLESSGQRLISIGKTKRIE